MCFSLEISKQAWKDTEKFWKNKTKKWIQEQNFRGFIGEIAPPPRFYFCKEQNIWLGQEPWLLD